MRRKRNAQYPHIKDERRRAWHIIRLNKDGQPYLGNYDDRVIEVGKWYRMKGCSATPKLCNCGMHACMNLLDAYKYICMDKLALFD